MHREHAATYSTLILNTFSDSSNPDTYEKKHKKQKRHDDDKERKKRKKEKKRKKQKHSPEHGGLTPSQHPLP